MIVGPSLGTLGVLPRELRDMVYAYSLDGSYVIAYTEPHRRPLRKGIVGIVVASKQVIKEAMPIFYAGSRFVYAFEHDHIYYRHQDFLTVHPISNKHFENLMDITLTVDMTQREAFYLMSDKERDMVDDYAGVLSACSLRRLHEDNVVRRRINVKYIGLGFPYYVGKLVSLPLLQDTKNLTCFKFVILELISAKREIAGEIVMLQMIIYEQAYQDTDEVRAGLETALGPATTTDGLLSTQAHSSTASDTQSLTNSANTIDFNLASHYFDWRLEFHPLDRNPKI